MYPTKSPIRRIGNCEIKDEHVNIEIFLTDGDIWMCKECKIEQDKELAQRKAESKTILEEVKKKSGMIEMKQDLFNAGTVSFIDIQAAIENNDDIPADKKLNALVHECADLIAKLNSAIFMDEATLVQKKNARNALTVNAQNLIARFTEADRAKLQESEREKFKQFDISYKPKAVKSVKPKVTRTSRPRFSKVELYAAANKYKVEASDIRSLMLSHSDWTYEQAGKYMAELLNPSLKGV